MSTMNHDPISRRRLLSALGAAGAAAVLDPVAAHGAADAGPSSPFLTIGVIGGLGPQATMDFEARLHRVAQRLIPPRENSGYPPVVVYYHRHPPFAVNDDLKPRFPLEPDARLLDAARRLGAWADFLVITSNGPHLIQEQIEQASGRRVLSLIDVTLADIARRGWTRVGVMGFGDPLIYTGPLGRRGVATETLPADVRARLDREIMRVMEGRDDRTSFDAARDAVALLRLRGVEGIVLGCTEIPLLLRDVLPAPHLVDPAELLAEAAVRKAAALPFPI